MKNVYFLTFFDLPENHEITFIVSEQLWFRHKHNSAIFIECTKRVNVVFNDYFYLHSEQGLKGEPGESFFGRNFYHNEADTDMRMEYLQTGPPGPPGM